ncbi:uncharacterized protein LOC133898598 [Phragmites australis]|uniref:uncharacterized protein LOC133898598 n=1 Tax=Phragmites australis TaxID=29695 RepID=UPI002D7772DC|nr:uncharacterized protein LOC133898598 [Phragmites australis]
MMWAASQDEWCTTRPSDVHRRSSVSAPTRPLLSRLGGSEQHGPSAQVSTQPRRLSPVRPQSDYFGDEAGPSSAAPHPTPPPPQRTTARQRGLLLLHRRTTQAPPASTHGRLPSLHSPPTLVRRMRLAPTPHTTSSVTSSGAHLTTTSFSGPRFPVHRFGPSPRMTSPRHRWSLLGLADTSAHLTPSPTPGVT